MNGDTLIYSILIGLIVSIFIGKYIYVWYAEIHTRNKLASAQIKLLSLIALKLDVDGNKVLEVLNEIEKK